MANERVFEKDGHEVSTASPSAAVDLKARGYREVLDGGSSGPSGHIEATVHAGEQVLNPDAARKLRDQTQAQPTPPKPDYPKSD
jgi:hypothetical protein